jgi:hypothetical protein
MTIDSFSPDAYEHQLTDKLDRLQQEFAEFSLPAIGSLSFTVKTLPDARRIQDVARRRHRQLCDVQTG